MGIKEYLLAAGSKDKKDLPFDNPFANIGFDGEDPRLGWVIPPEFPLIADRLQQISQLLQDKKHFVFVGMGGSINGVKSIASFDKNKSIYTIDSLDPAALSEILRRVEPAKTLVIAISKSSTTKETQLIAKSLGQVISKENFIWLIDLGNKEKLFSQGWQDINIFPIQPDLREDIGGRFSSPHTLIFLLPLFIILGKDINRLEAVWSQYVSLRKVLLDKSYSLAEKHKNSTPAYFNLKLKENLKDNLYGWLVQLFNESLGSKKEKLAVKTLVSAEDEDIEGFWPLSLDIDIDDYFVYIMAHMYFSQCFVSFYAYFQNIVFVNQPYVEVYKKAMRSQEGIIQNKPAVFWRDMPEILKQNPSFDSKKFIEVVLYFYPKEGFIEELSRALSHQIPHKKNLVFIGSDWNHHSYQAAFKSEDTLYVIACLEEYEICPYIDKNIIQENVNTLKVISVATFSTLKDKAEFMPLKTLV